MLRRTGLVLGLLALLAIGGGNKAHAQFGYGYYPRGYGGYGWGGWGGGGTVQGSIARGLGYYATGLGNLERSNAVAGSINTDTWMRYENFMYNSQLQANHNERLRMDAKMRRDAGAGDGVNNRPANQPTDADITSGNALNAALDQITNPRVHSSALRLATTKIPGKVIREIPFVNASEAVTISLDQLTADSGWPAALREPQFDDGRKAYSAAVDQALKEDRDGEIATQTVKQMRAALSRLKATLESVPATDRARFGEAETYLKTLYGMTRMLEKPEYEKIVAELDSIKETTLGSLLGFMHTFNLRFGRPTTPEQRLAYEQLYPIIAEHRDRVMKDAGLVAKDDNTPPPPPSGDFFSGMKFEHLDGPHRYGPASTK